MTERHDCRSSELKTIECGYVRKAHGHRGKAIIALSSELFADMDPDFLFITIEGIPVPFKVADINGTYPNLIVKLTRLSSDREVERYRSLPVSISVETYERLLDQHPDDLDDHLLIGCVVHHSSGQVLGHLLGIDDTTRNHLMIIKDDQGKEIMIPLVEEWLHQVNMKERMITLDCPLELIDL